MLDCFKLPGKIGIIPETDIISNVGDAVLRRLQKIAGLVDPIIEKISIALSGVKGE